MDHKQRESLANLLDKQAWYIATAAGDHFTNDEFEEAKAEYQLAKREFIGCESAAPLKVEIVPTARHLL